MLESELQTKRNNKGQFMKGNVPWLKGKTHSPETRKKWKIERVGKYLGELSPTWKGGRTHNTAGYVLIYKSNHPYNKRRYVLEHRLVMENHIGRYLKPTEVIHHINGIKDDNRIENLKLFDDHVEHKRQENHGKSVTPKEVRTIRRLLKYMSAHNIADLFNVTSGCIYGIKNNDNWKWVK